MKRKRPINYHKHERRQGALAWIITSVIVWILVLVSISSCGTTNRYVQGQRDSIFIERLDTIIFRDTTILFQPSDSTATNIVNTDSTSCLETDLAVSVAQVKEGKLMHSLSNKRSLIPVKVVLPKSISQVKHYLFRTITEKVEVETPLKWHQEALMFIGRASIFLILLFLIIKLIKSKL